MNTKSDITLYRQKGRDSFKTRLNLYLFDYALQRPLGSLSDINKAEFGVYKASKELIIRYTTEYWQLKKEYQFGNKTIAVIELEIKTWKEDHKEVINSLQQFYIDEIFKSVFPFEEFVSLINTPQKECHYCHINEQMIDDLINKQMLFKKRLRGFKLEIDRKKPNLEYTKNNSVLCCYWCNNAKTDEFCDDEFKGIGDEMKKIWQSRLQKQQ